MKSLLTQDSLKSNSNTNRIMCLLNTLLSSMFSLVCGRINHRLIISIRNDLETIVLNKRGATKGSIRERIVLNFITHYLAKELLLMNSKNQLLVKDESVEFDK